MRFMTAIRPVFSLFALVLLFPVLVISVPCRLVASDVGSPQWMGSLSEAHQLALREQRLILLHFWAPTCGPCLQLEQSVLSRDEVRQAMGRHYAAVKIDISKEPELARYFQIRSIPTDVIVTATGAELHRQVSAQDPGKFVGMLEQFAVQSRLTPEAGGSDSPTAFQASSPETRGSDNMIPPQPGHSWGNEFTEPARLPVGLEGFCPVSLVEENRWQAGDARVEIAYHQFLYRFASPEHRDRFLIHPNRYVPAFSGFDVVQYRELGRNVMGRREHGVVFGEHYFLFADEEGLRRFWETPHRYANLRAETQAAQAPAGNVRR